MRSFIIAAAFLAGCVHSQTETANVKAHLIEATDSPREIRSRSGCEFDDRTFYSPKELCLAIINSADEPFYLAVRTISLSQPSSESLLVYRVNGKWLLVADLFTTNNIAPGVGYRQYETDARSVALEISPQLMEGFQAQWESLRANKRQEELGPLVVCLDGESLHISVRADGYENHRSRHMCEGRTELDDFADIMVRLALEVDPKLAPFVDNLSLPKESS